MPASQATIPTAAASRYLQQLCKHWSHKFGRVHARAWRHSVRRNAPVHTRCLARGLALRIEAADDATLERTQGVVIDHLKRFAFREDLGEVRWEKS